MYQRVAKLGCLVDSDDQVNIDSVDGQNANKLLR